MEGMLSGRDHHEFGVDAVPAREDQVSHRSTGRAEVQEAKRRPVGQKASPTASPEKAATWCDTAGKDAYS